MHSTGSSDNAVAFETILQFRGTIDITILDGSTGGNVSTGKSQGIDIIVLLFVLIFSVVVEFKFPSPTNSSTSSSSLLVILE